MHQYLLFIILMFLPINAQEAPLVISPLDKKPQRALGALASSIHLSGYLSSPVFSSSPKPDIMLPIMAGGGIVIRV